MNIYFLFITLLLAAPVFAKTYILGTGRWSDTTLWGGDYMGVNVGENDVVIVIGQVLLDRDVNVEGVIIVKKGAALFGVKNLTISSNGKLENNGSVVVKRILNKGAIINNMLMEAMTDIENKSLIVNNEMMVTGNDFNNISGFATGLRGVYFINNKTNFYSGFDSNVKVYIGNAIGY